MCGFIGGSFCSDCTGLAEERRIVARSGAFVLCGAVAAAAARLDQSAPAGYSGILSFGICGALAPGHCHVKQSPSGKIRDRLSDGSGDPRLAVQRVGFSFVARWVSRKSARPNLPGERDQGRPGWIQLCFASFCVSV
jgi:hypothetical protein